MGKQVAAGECIAPGEDRRVAAITIRHYFKSAARYARSLASCVESGMLFNKR